MAIEHYRISDHDVYLLTLATPADWPDTLPQPAPRFSLMILADYEEFSPLEFDAFARKTIRQGLDWMTAWGPNAAGIHMAFDHACVQMNREENRDEDSEYHATTDHWEVDEFDEALWFFLVTVCFSVDAESPAPDGSFPNLPQYIVLLGDHPDWLALLRSRLAAPHGDWTDRVLDRP